MWLALAFAGLLSPSALAQGQGPGQDPSAEVSPVSAPQDMALPDLVGRIGQMRSDSGRPVLVGVPTTADASVLSVAFQQELPASTVQIVVLSGAPSTSHLDRIRKALLITRLPAGLLVESIPSSTSWRVQVVSPPQAPPSPPPRQSLSTWELVQVLKGAQARSADSMLILALGADTARWLQPILDRHLARGALVLVDPDLRSAEEASDTTLLQERMATHSVPCGAQVTRFTNGTWWATMVGCSPTEPTPSTSPVAVSPGAPPSAEDALSRARSFASTAREAPRIDPTAMARRSAEVRFEGTRLQVVHRPLGEEERFYYPDLAPQGVDQPMTWDVTRGGEALGTSEIARLLQDQATSDRAATERRRARRLSLALNLTGGVLATTALVPLFFMEPVDDDALDNMGVTWEEQEAHREALSAQGRNEYRAWTTAALGAGGVTVLFSAPFAVRAVRDRQSHPALYWSGDELQPKIEAYNREVQVELGLAPGSQSVDGTMPPGAPGAPVSAPEGEGGSTP